MELLLDNPEAENIFKKIIRSIPPMQNGITAESLKKRGIKYDKAYGTSIVDLKQFARQFDKNHLLALKLWNKNWRETMILATLLDEPAKVTEEQMDFWVKTAENTEIIEQMVTNLFTETPFAFVKALEWCRGKKHRVRYAGILMMGRLSVASKNDIDEMFESFFDVLPPLTKDMRLHTVLHRSMCQLARRSKKLHKQCVSFTQEIMKYEEENARKIGNEIHTEITSDYFTNLIKE
ncbi:MAG TPA: DNA alkylation repair protein [Prolixibacteraceae bacterium]|nr:DNA alkylation repair protein [Prolixibacteraceae bacterium]